MPGPEAAELDRVVAAAAERTEAVLAAYVFGSRARGASRPASDLDVALLVRPGRSLSLEDEDRLRREIAAVTGLAVDVARLDATSPVLAFEVLEGGRRVFAREPELADELEEGLLRRYLDTEHLRRVQREYFFEGRD